MGERGMMRRVTRHFGNAQRAECIGRLACTMAIGGCLFLTPPAAGHAVFMTCIRHDAAMTAGPANLDIRIELTFYEMRSLAERRRMDRDGDGTITAGELDRYRAWISGNLARGVRLHIDGRPVDILPLYEPEIDLLDVERVQPAHHVLRVFCFARTPTWLQPDSRIVLEDALWPGPAVPGSLEAAGCGGVEVRAESDAGPPLSGGETAGPCVMHVRCLAVPPNVGHRSESPSSAPATEPACAGAEQAGSATPGVRQWLVMGVIIGILSLLGAGAVGGIRSHARRCRA